MVAGGGWSEMSYIQQEDENSRKANEDAMEVIDRYYLDGLNRKKTQAEAACTRTRIKIMALMIFWATIKKTNKRGFTTNTWCTTSSIRDNGWNSDLRKTDW